jgi:hypothetical protein
MQYEVTWRKADGRLHSVTSHSHGEALVVRDQLRHQGFDPELAVGELVIEPSLGEGVLAR